MVDRNTTAKRRFGCSVQSHAALVGATCYLRPAAHGFFCLSRPKRDWFLFSPKPILSSHRAFAARSSPASAMRCATRAPRPGMWNIARSRDSFIGDPNESFLPRGCKHHEFLLRMNPADPANQRNPPTMNAPFQVVQI